MGFAIESKRLILRKLTKDDFEALKRFLGDPEVMYAWEHGFTDQEIYDWIEKNLKRYQKDGFGYFAVIEKSTGELIGNIGLIKEEIKGKSELCLGYILAKRFWGKGYAREGAQACMDYAFKYLIADQVIADIRPENTPSRLVADALGMKQEGEFIKIYQHKEMPHLIYKKTRDDLESIW